MKYHVSAADRRPLPARYHQEARYLGLRDADLDQPYARFFSPRTSPIQDDVQRTLTAGMAPTEYGYPIEAAAERLAAPGHDVLENGWTQLKSGVIFVAVRTDMPGVSAAMWDWWFGWHGGETTRYKLWHPEAHQFCVMGEDRSANPGLSDRERYIDNVSYVDEYIGGVTQPLAIRFVDPRTIGIDPAPESTHICARVSLSTLPLAFGWLIHQVRPTERGVEMRSRFFLNTPEILNLPLAAFSAAGASARLLPTSTARRLLSPILPRVTSRLMPSTIGTDMMFHCAAEMNHLANFLPELHQEFSPAP
ncbi:MAG: hypothetical protein QM572_00825 [Nocardioides sp.]|uniref:DAPG hydrolase family protein n=1 Tax=Nocardioides sp. TaxID=35761 RepID=UPI0039E245E6